MIHYIMDQISPKNRKKESETHPESLLGQEVRVTTPSPQALRNVSPCRIVFCPSDPCTGPFFLLRLELPGIRMLEGLE